MIVQEIKSALETLNNPSQYNQALIDCQNVINLSIADLENHFTSWLWLAEGTDYKNGVDKAYAIQLGTIEEALVYQGLIYKND